MPLQKQNVSISFNQGVDSKTDKKQVIQGKMLTLENAEFDSLGQFSKRNGYTSFSTLVKTDPSLTFLNSTLSSTVTAGKLLAEYNNEIVLGDGFNLYSYSPSIAQWAYKGRNTICEVDSTWVVRSRDTQSQADSAISSFGAKLFAWEDSSGGVRASVTDSITGQVFIPNFLVSATGTRPRCLALGTQLLCFYFDTSTNTINYVAVNSGTVSTAVQFRSDVNTTHTTYDATVIGGTAFVAYNSSGNTNNQISVALLTGSLVAGQVLNISGSKADNVVAVWGDLDGSVWLGWNDATNSKWAIAAPNLGSLTTAVTTVAAAANVFNMTGVVTALGVSTVFWDVKGTAVNSTFPNSIITYAQLSTSAVTLAPTEFMRSAGIQSKAFTVNMGTVAIPHLLAVHDSTLQPTYFLASIFNNTATARPFHLAAKACLSTAGGTPVRPMPSSVNVVSPNVFQTAALEKDLFYTGVINGAETATFSQTGVKSLSFDFTVSNPSATVQGQSLVLGGGMLNMYDGSSVTELGFPLWPEGTTLSAAATGGFMAVGSFGYILVYEWTDAQGQTHQSSPSPVVTAVITGAGNGAVTLTIPTLRITQKQDVNIVIYRTAVNGTTYYRLNVPSAPKANSLSADTVTYVDTVQDNAIQSSQQLYTAFEVENIAAPASLIQTVFKNRVILIPSEDPSQWWFSKQTVPGSPVEFSDLFSKSVSTDGGDLTAVATLDASLILFKSFSILYVQGDGPAPNGVGDNFTEAQAIPSDVGCANQASLVLTPMGLLFQAAKGIYLLNRSLQVEYIGKEAEGLIGSATVTSSQLMVSTNQVRFTLSTGITIVFDTLTGQWDTFTNVNASSSIMSQGVFTYLNPTGKVLQETPGMFTDDGSAVKLRADTSWLSLAGLQGFQRVYKVMILGNYVSSHKLSVKIAYDFNPNPSQEVLIDATSVINPSVYGGDATYGSGAVYGGLFGLYEFRIDLTQQKCSAIQISIQDVQSPPYGEALTLSAIVLEVGVKAGLNKKSSSNQFGA